MGPTATTQESQPSNWSFHEGWRSVTTRSSRHVVGAAMTPHYGPYSHGSFQLVSDEQSLLPEHLLETHHELLARRHAERASRVSLPRAKLTCAFDLRDWDHQTGDECDVHTPTYYTSSACSSGTHRNVPGWATSPSALGCLLFRNASWLVRPRTYQDWLRPPTLCCDGTMK